MRVNIKRIDTSLPLPKYETPGAVAFDFIARQTTVIEPKGVGRVGSNIVLEIPKGYMLLVKDRSSTAKKKGILMTAGVIDQDYCGDNDEILMQFYNPSDNAITVERGERLAQGIFVAVGIGNWEEVDTMNRKDRGGFGSTDKIGKLIILYGINNLGKSTQAKLLADRLFKQGKKAEYVKYHAYGLQPTGEMINEYLRSGNPYRLNDREFQILAAVNKYHNQPEILSLLESGINIVAEDYWATSIAWGVASGVDKDFLTRLNQGIVREDIAFLFDGERFLESRESLHQFESDDDLARRARAAHYDLAREYGWIMINANKAIQEIHEFIWEKVSKII